MSFTIHKTDNGVEISEDENGQYKSFDEVCTEIISQGRMHVIESITISISGEKYQVKEGVDRFYDRPSYQGLVGELERGKLSDLERVKQEQKERNYINDEALSSINFVTSSTIAGMRIVETLGMARGSTVRAKHIGRDLMVGLKNIVGGEIKGYTELLAEGREEAIYRMKVDALSLGATAVVDVRFGTSTLADGLAEIIAYGTAVKTQEDS